MGRRARQGPGSLRLIKQLLRTMADEEAGLWPRFDQAAIFQFKISLHGGRHAHAMLPAGPAHRGNSIAGPENATFDQLADVRRDPGVERFAPDAGGSRNNHGTKISHRIRSKQTVPA